MLAVERRKKIKEIVVQNKSGTVLELAKIFSVTEETIRRDLKQLEVEGLLIRTYGGAYVKDSAQNEVNVEIREKIYVENKQVIARKCASLISNGDTIFLDSSTTALHICNTIQDKHITVVSNSLKVLNKFSENRSIELFCIGGVYSAKSMSFVGRNACKALQQYHVDKAFVSCDSLHMDYGLTDSSERQADIRQLAIQHAQEVYLVADYTKFDKTAFVAIADFSSITGVVVDQAPSEAWQSFLAEKHIPIY